MQILSGKLLDFRNPLAITQTRTFLPRLRGFLIGVLTPCPPPKPWIRIDAFLSSPCLSSTLTNLTNLEEPNHSVTAHVAGGQRDFSIDCHERRQVSVEDEVWSYLYVICVWLFFTWLWRWNNGGNADDSALIWSRSPEIAFISIFSAVFMLSITNFILYFLLKAFICFKRNKAQATPLFLNWAH